MSDHATRSCDGCSTAAFVVPYVGRETGDQLDREARQRGWTSPIRGVWLCPSCAAITDLGTGEAVTEAMW